MDELFDKIKGSASKAKDSASKIAKEVAKRTSKAFTQTKLSFSVSETQSKIKDVYSEIGKSLYERHLDGNDYEEFADELAQIDRLIEELETLTSKIAELKNSLKCPECGSYNANTSDYCSKCGARLPDVEDYEYDDDIDDAFTEADIDEHEDEDEDVIIITPQKPEQDEE